jgi:CHAT domain-containing protein/Tfp pilus assembly protein PilF
MNPAQQWTSLAVALSLWSAPVAAIAQETSSPPSLGQADPLERANNLNQQAFELYQAGRYDEAIPLAEEVVTIQRQQLGDNHLNVATSLSNLAELYQARGNYGDAETLYQEALNIRRQQLGDSHPDVALSLHKLARLYQDQGRYDEAIPLAEEVVAILRWQLGNDHPDVAISLNNLAALYQNQDRYSEAESLYIEALAIYRQQLGNDHPDVATSLNNLAGLYQDQGRYGEAETFFLEALTIRRQQLGNNRSSIATSLNNLAGLYQAQGRYGEAEPLYLEALAIVRQQLVETHPFVAMSLNNLATLYQNQGRYGEAEPLFLEALAIYRQQLGDTHPDVATSLNNLAGLYQDQGRYGEAEPLFLEALTIRRQQLDSNHPDIASSLNNLAGLYRKQGRDGNAEPLLQEALAILRQQINDKHPDFASSLNNLATLYQDQGRYGEAESLYLESLNIYRQQFGDNHPNIAISLNNLASLYKDHGNYGEAEPLYLESLGIWRQQLGDNHPNVALSFNNLAMLYWAQGNGKEAVTTQQTSLAIEEFNLALNLATLAEAQRQDYAAVLKGSTDIALSLHLQGAAESPEAAEMALTTVLRRKGRILEAGVDSVQRLRQNLSPDDQQLLDDLTTTRQQLAALTFNPPPNLDRARVERLETEINQLEAELARRSAAFRVEALPVEIAAVQAEIPTNGVLIEYARYRPFDPTTPQNPWGEDRYAVYLLFPNGRIEAVDLGSADEIDGAVGDFIRLLQDRSATLRAGARPERLVADVQAITGQMQALILAPISPYLRDRDHLLISPDSQLNLIPFEALQSEAGGPFLVEQYQISYLSSGRDLLKFDLNAPSQQPAVVLADPDYDQASGPPRPGLGEGRGVRASQQRSNELAQIQVGPLPGTAAEAEAIAPLLPNATILTQAEATENVLKQVQAPEILHLATHGFFLTDVQRPEPSGRGLGLVTVDGPGIPVAPAGVAVENPLLRSGLALAGFNRRASGSEDGVLTALEVASLDLLGTRLVVLSACYTGLGDVANGEGVYGLRRAFALAGAESQLLSLWQVDDFGTQSLMARYYEHLTAGMGRSEALRQVQLAMIAADDRYSHPFYWAAFVLTGDWRSLSE